MVSKSSSEEVVSPKGIDFEGKQDLSCEDNHSGLGSEQFRGNNSELDCENGMKDDGNLANMYSKCGYLVDACRVFYEMPCKDEVSWMAMIDGYTKNGNFEEASLAFKKMVYE
ncbi:hypothetical protein IFM89_022551 [Coptis chinensis]|uniref:Pentatricopeptide repeat-containing protein n=1 Tax=Coptis chinensis TaxID=261450 RepID=A0A835IDR3_9MAGN|nr:hypothetical protein IFM89_022551 [Coptis chinensis]